ncbi:MAG: MBL fold metallo-hydrolase [Kiritimatiellaeota bacterium]|nr:MBL fold metallo-hydrolase [Kiritimatiellota bacterium]
MEFCVLASGSKGNCTYVASDETAVLIDMGLSSLETVSRLREAEISPAAIQAVLFSHDHTDHYRGVEVFSRKFPVRLLANEGTASGIDCAFPKARLKWEIFETATAFDIGDLHIEAFPVSHDASDPVGFTVANGRSCLGIMTDFGQSSALVRNKLSKCDALILESNHDYDMLMASNRPWPLKTRVAGRSGHLSNDDAADLLKSALPQRLRLLLLAHISEECNTHALARQAMQDALLSIRRPDIKLGVLYQNKISARFTV